MNSQDKQYQSACLQELKPIVGKCITGLIKDDSGYFGFETEDSTQVWINRDAEGNGPGFPGVVLRR